jgi:hypothetical protein
MKKTAQTINKAEKPTMLVILLAEFAENKKTKEKTNPKMAPKRNREWRILSCQVLS